MIIEGVKTIKCRRCKIEFEPFYRNGIILSRFCTKCLVEKKREKDKKEWREEKKKIKEKLKTQSEWLSDLQKVFNKYIRLRDRNKPCISCGNPLKKEFDAGHFFSVGAYPNIRFNEDNVHGQCVACNQHKHGNINEYALNLPLRIGKERYENLLEDRNKPLMLTIPEIKVMIKEYRDKIKDYERNTA